MNQQLSTDRFNLTALFLFKEKGRHLSATDLKDSKDEKHHQPIAYRPYKIKYAPSDGHPNPFTYKNNIALVAGINSPRDISITDRMIASDFFQGVEAFYFPLFRLSENRLTLNLNKNILTTLSEKLYLEFLPEKPESGNVCFAESPEVRDDFKTHFTALNLMDYIYAVLHESKSSPSNTSFPFIPFPSENTFWKRVESGRKLRTIHLTGQTV